MNRRGSPVFVVDDNDDAREGLRMILESEGWKVETARDGREALNRLIGGFRPCIILIDLMSPVMNGPEFRREQMSHPPLRRIPLVAYSGLAGVRDKARALAGSDDDSVVMPVEIERLLAAVRHRCTV